MIDAQGNAVAATLSVNLPFGAAFTVPDTGVVLNNEMDDFAADTQGANSYGLAGSQANAVAAGKRPLSSMSPSFLESPTDFAAFGTPGGSRIPSMVLISMLQYFDGRPVGQWVAAPRYHHQYKPDVVEYEPRAFSDAEAAELRRRGYQLKRLERSYGNQQVLYWDKRSGLPHWLAASTACCASSALASTASGSDGAPSMPRPECRRSAAPEQSATPDSSPSSAA